LCFCVFCWFINPDEAPPPKLVVWTREMEGTANGFDLGLPQRWLESVLAFWDVWSGRSSRTFRRDTLPPSAGFKSNASKQSVPSSLLQTTRRHVPEDCYSKPLLI
jgi:hypothetical protein